MIMYNKAQLERFLIQNKVISLRCADSIRS